MKHIMRRKDNFSEINEMRKILQDTKKLTLENFIMPDEEIPYGDEEMAPGAPEGPQGTENVEVPKYSDEIKDAIVKIRKISIGVIAKLADNPTSDGYVFMKRVLDMSDKAMESMYNPKS